MNRFASELIEKSIEHIKQAGISQHDAVIVGVSGGADSMALLQLVHRAGLHGMVAHVNYGKRGIESDKDQELVEQTSKELGFTCRSYALNPGDAVHNFQNWARNERYRIFRELKEQYGAAAIVVAHHRDDQIETILQKLFRGGGVSSWQGMSVWDGEILRPLLDCSKADILEFCAEYHIPFRTDASNLESDYARNFLRNEFAPKLTEHFPGWETNILALPEKAGVTRQALNLLLEQISEAESLRLHEFAGWPETLRLSLLLQFLERFDCTPTKGQLEELLALCSLETGRKLTLNGGLTVVKDRDMLVFKRKKTPFGGRIRLEREELKTPIMHNGFNFVLSAQPPDTVHLRIDSRKLAWPLWLRSWRAGDRITPLGMSGSQKISDHLTNLKISAAIKGNALVLSADDDTIYAVLLPQIIKNNRIGTISELVKGTPQTKEYLIITSK